jgi:hypothetical protein
MNTFKTAAIQLCLAVFWIVVTYIEMHEPSRGLNGLVANFGTYFSYLLHNPRWQTITYNGMNYERREPHDYEAAFN